MTTKHTKYPKYLQDQIDKLAENFPNAMITISCKDGVYSITEIDIDGKYTESLYQEQRSINDALDEKRGLNLTDSEIALK